MVVVCAAGANAAVTMSELFSDHMVIQRNVPVHVWGMADAGETVTVDFRGAHVAGEADTLGRWSLYLPPGPEGGPFTLKVNATTFSDVLVGDVWVASGQSNMEFSMHNVNNAPAEIAAANYPKIRLLSVRRKVSEYPFDRLPGAQWFVCTPQSAADFSAVAFFFAREVQAHHDVPIGLIHASWGGTPAEAWTSAGTLSADASLMPVYYEWARTMQELPDTMLRRQQQLAKWQSDVDAAKAAGRQAPGKPWAPNEDNSWRPSALYNGMIAPLTPFPIRGVIWYQGESNASKERASLYHHLFAAMIEDWRRQWGVGDFPFLFVQLANYKSGDAESWAVVREAQRQTLSLANTGMAVAIDVGTPNDIHPKNKQEVGKRLALAARAVTYGDKLEYSGPVLLQAVKESGAIRVWFEHAAGLKASSGDLRGFEVAGPDHHFVPGTGRVEGSSVVVTNIAVREPHYVRYGWSDNPDCNLVNSAGLPASPFQTGQ